ncbi:MAG TPA: hypothetical protein VGD99_12805 [Anaerolineae bacterium]
MTIEPKTDPHRELIIIEGPLEGPDGGLNRRAQDAAAQLLAELEEASLPPRVIAAFRKRGQAITLETIAAEILADVRPPA